MSVIKMFNPRSKCINAISKFFVISPPRGFTSLTSNHVLTRDCDFTSVSSYINFVKYNGINLTPFNVCAVPSCGMKVKGKLKLRCCNCFFVMEDGRMMVKCSSYPRHKQMEKIPKEKRTWILSHAMQSKKRPY